MGDASSLSHVQRSALARLSKLPIMTSFYRAGGSARGTRRHDRDDGNDARGATEGMPPMNIGNMLGSVRTPRESVFARC